MGSKFKYLLLIAILLLVINEMALSQGRNAVWLIGYMSTPTARARMTFTDTSSAITSEIRNIPFLGSTQGNIADEQGNLLMSSNGQFIANATGDTMLNGAGLNPNQFTASWLNGLPVPNGNVFLPMPGDSNKYFLLHHTYGDFGGPSPPTELYFSIVDITGDGGLGEVILKNQIFFQDSLGLGFGVVKHANGRDWWLLAISDSSNYMFLFDLTPAGINYNQTVNVQVIPYEFSGAIPNFSADGTKIAYTRGSVVLPNGKRVHEIVYFDFDRCSGQFSNQKVINIPDSIGGGCVMFSPNSRYLYVASWQRIYQIDTYAANIPASLQLIAVNDTFASPNPPFFTDFFHMYLAANGKIYITSGSGVVDLHVINYPDSAGTACDVKLHDIHLPTFHARSYPFHPNYYLGPLAGSPCDTITSVNNIEHHFNFSVAPNPSTGTFKIMYLLPQNKSGTLSVYDITGREVYSLHLPPWSILQNLNLSNLPNGLYHATISSDVYRVSKKIVFIN